MRLLRHKMLAFLLLTMVVVAGCISTTTKQLAAKLAVDGPALEAEILAACPDLPAPIKRDLHAYVAGQPLVAAGIGATPPAQ